MNMKIDLNAPAFGEGAQKIEEVADETEVKPAIEAKETKEEEKELEASEESKVPYSRFKKFHDRALEAERDAAEWRAKAESANEVRRETNTPEIDLQDEAYKLWLENFGDNDASRKAWQNNLKINASLEQRAIERAKDEAIKAVQNERENEARQTEDNVKLLDESFEDLSALVGRDLTEKEQNDVLDIVDDYTPKDDDGNYLGELLPFNKAWEIYELKTAAQKVKKAASRNAVAGISANQTQGEAQVDAEKDKTFNPLDWGAWRKRL